MEEFLRPYTEEELEYLLQQSGYSEIARAYCLEELNDWYNYMITDEIAYIQKDLLWESEHDTTDIPYLVRELCSRCNWTMTTLREEAWQRVIRDNKVKIYCDQIAQGRTHGWARNFAATLANNPTTQNIYKDVYETYMNGIRQRE